MLKMTSAVGEPPKKHGLLYRMGQYRESYLLITPFMLLFLIFTVIPVLASIVLSFTSFNMLSMPRFVGFQNYERMLLDDPIFFIVVKKHLCVRLPDRAVKLCPLLCLCLAYQ